MWMPIGTAPKIPGRSILTYGVVPEDYGYSRERWTVSVSEWCGTGWASQAGGGGFSGPRFNPTHWMPLPDAPEETK